MQSYRTKQTFTLLFTLFIITILFSCTKETKKTPTKIYDDTKNEELSSKKSLSSTYTTSKNIYIPPNEEQLSTIQNTEKNTSKYYLDDRIISPSRTSAFTKEIGNSTLYSVTAVDGSNGYIFNVFVPKGKSVIGKHNLAENGNFLILNQTEDGFLNIYNTKKCSDGIGHVTINKHNGQTISGSFETKICNHGQIGKKGEKFIPLCRFNQVQIDKVK